MIQIYSGNIKKIAGLIILKNGLLQFCVIMVPHAPVKVLLWFKALLSL